MAKTVFLLKSVKNSANDPLPPSDQNFIKLVIKWAEFYGIRLSFYYNLVRFYYASFKFRSLSFTCFRVFSSPTPLTTFLSFTQAGLCFPLSISLKRFFHVTTNVLFAYPTSSLSPLFSNNRLGFCLST